MNPRPRHWIAEVLIALVWLLPVLVPYAAGLWWLFEHNLLLHWVLGVLGISVALMLLARLLKSRQHGVTVRATDVNAAEAEKRARAALRPVVEGATAADLETAKSVERLLRRALTEVAEAWNPGASRAELRFTLPEALTLAEHLSRRLRVVIHEDLPSIEHVQIAHVVYFQRGVKPARALWTLYRLGRFAFNPMGSVVVELRRGVLKTLTPVLMDSVKAKAAALLARETGEAAILLYSGRLRRDPAQLASDSPDLSAEPETGPLTLLVAGQPNAGKSSLINALSGRARAVVSPLPCETGFTAHALENETAGELVLVDSPGLTDAPDKAWLREAARADVVVWVAAAHRADRAVDQTALRALRTRHEQDLRARRAPVVLALTHADRLDPAAEWDPPYNPEKGKRPKEQTFRAARAAACEVLGVPSNQTALLVTRDPESPWNLEAFWTAIHAALPDARRTRLERLLTQRGRLDGVSATVRTLPGLVRQLKTTFKQSGADAEDPGGG